MWIDMKHFFISLLLTVLLIVPLSGCSSSGAKDGKEKQARAAQAAPPDLPLPVIPANLATPEERADYLALHFWDAMDWHDRSLALDTAFMEQNFANYVSGLPYATETGLRKAVSALMDTVCKAGADQRDFLFGVASKYLFEQDSPYRDEMLFLPFVDWALGKDYDTVRAGQFREDIMRNRVGSEAADFSFTLRDGHKDSLRAFRGRPVLLMFYDPDCDLCREAEEQLIHSESFRRLIDRGALQMLAVYVGDKKQAWALHADKLPQSWTVGIDSEMRIDEEELYTIGATPSFYLIDASGKVMEKDAPLSRILMGLQ